MRINNETVRKRRFFSMVVVVVVCVLLAFLLVLFYLLPAVPLHQSGVVLRPVYAVVLCLSVSSGLLVLLLYLSSLASGVTPIFPGAMEALLAHSVVDCTRFLQHLTIPTKSACPVFFSVELLMVPVCYLWMAAIFCNVSLLVNAKQSDYQRQRIHDNYRRSHWLIALVATSLAMGCYFIGVHEHQDLFIIVDDTCNGHPLLFYDMVAMPVVVVIVVIVLSRKFKLRVRYFYPEAVALKIEALVNRYVYVFSFSSVSVACLFLLQYVLSDQSRRSQSKAFDVMVYLGWGFFHFQGIYGSYIIWKDFIFSPNRKLGMHLQAINPEEVDLGSTLEVLGEGSYATVYKGKWHNEIVAVKIFQDVELDIPKIKLEAFLATKLHHENVLRTFGCCLMKNDEIAIITECIEGGTLEHLTSSTEVVTYFNILRISQMIARGMNFLHSKNPPIIHRDLKPSNCLISEDHKVLKIADFGCSRLISYEITNTLVKSCINRNSLTMTSNVGSLCWTAPELIADTLTVKYSTKADVFSFGIIVWQLYTRKEPYSNISGSLLELGNAITDGTRPAIPKECPTFLCELITSAWHKNPKLRPSFNKIDEWLQVEMQKELEIEKNSLDRCFYSF